MISGLVFQKQLKELPLGSKAQLKSYLLSDKDEREEHFRLRELQIIMRSCGESGTKWQGITLAWLKITYSNWPGQQKILTLRKCLFYCLHLFLF